jgi:hypothetical protein
LPEKVKDLTAERVGDHVHLHWTTPAKTTDDLPIKGSITAQICRDPAPSSACTPVKRLTVQPGVSETVDPLPRALTLDPVALLSYRVQLLNANERSAGPSNEAFALAGAAPPPIEDLHATPVRAGAMLEWRPVPSTDTVELIRHLEGAPVPAKTTNRKSGPKPPAKTSTKPAAKPTAKPSPTPKSSKPEPPAETTLRTPLQASDPGGTIDRTAQAGETYRYVAQRVRTAALAGHSLEIRSDLSPPVVLLFKDTFPPATPTGLAAVPSGEDKPSIDLSWVPDTDPDLAGYILYRQAVSPSGDLTGPVIRLNADVLQAPAYRDNTAVVGQRYAYRVSAVDTVGNESAPSADVQEILREQ